MQSWPAAQSLFCLHCGFASTALWQYPALEQATKNASISKHCDSLAHVYSQKPATHA